MSGIGLDVTSISEAIPQKLRIRTIILIFTIIISTAIYFYIVNLYDENTNLISQTWRSLTQLDYNFYSGAKGGYYIKIGNQLESMSKTGCPIRIKNNLTTGGFENSIKVMNDSRSFGIVQEDTVMDGDFIRKHIRYITPLYLERMHIIYRKDKFKEKAKISPSSNILPFLSQPANPETEAFFENANVSTGPSGSGTKVIANYLLSQCEIELGRDFSLPLNEALERMQDDIEEKRQIHIAFTIAGAPLESLQKFLEENEKIGLMSINPALFPELNARFKLKLRMSTFKGIYKGNDDIITIGSYAFLICSPKIPNVAIMKFLEVLQEYKKNQMDIMNENHFPLKEFDFYEAFSVQYDGFLMETLRNILIFLITVTITSTGVYSFLTWLISGVRRVTYFKKITKIYSTYLPENTNLDEGNEPYPIPIIHNNQSPIIGSLIQGMKELLITAKIIREEYNAGGITSTHHEYLLKNVYSIRDIIQRNLTQRLNEVIESNGNISESDIRKYYTAGYLRNTDYRELLELFKTQKTIKTTEAELSV